MTDMPMGDSQEAPRIGWLASLARGRADDALLGARLEALDACIAQQPASAAPYVLRGEVHLARGSYALAAQDFEKGLALAQAQLAAEAWGLIAQALQDRALQGLERAQRRLP